MSIRKVESKPTESLKSHPKNVRTHSQKQIKQIAKSIQQFGFTSPIIIDEENTILAGHGRWNAAKFLQCKEVPVIVANGLSHAERRAYVLADNKLTENAGWDRAALSVELSELAPLLTEANLDLDVTGFEVAEIDALMADHLDRDDDPADEIGPMTAPPVSRPGELWELGPHRLLCGDARDPAAMPLLMKGEKAAMQFTDPPYNLELKTIQGRGKIKHKEFVAASGEMSKGEYTDFLAKALALASEHSLDGSIHYVCMDWRHLGELLAAGESAFSELKNIVVWNKTNAGQGSFYRSQHELILVFKLGEMPHLNNFELGQHGRHRSNVWSYAGANTFRRGRMKDLAMHPTVKPVALVADAMRDCSRRGDIILDPFMGSGTTIMAAERVGRRAFGLELDPLYVDTAVRRWQGYTKKDAFLSGADQCFDQVAASRILKDGDVR